MTSIIYCIEIHEFFTEDAGKTLCSSVGISSGCSLWLKKCHQHRIFFKTKNKKLAITMRKFEIKHLITTCNASFKTSELHQFLG